MGLELNMMISKSKKCRKLEKQNYYMIKSKEILFIMKINMKFNRLRLFNGHKNYINNSSEEFIMNLCATSFKVVLDDDVWRNFGYKKRPNRGGFC